MAPTSIVALGTFGVGRPPGLPAIGGRLAGVADRPVADRRRLLGRRSRPVDPGPPTRVSVSRATVIDAEPLGEEKEAQAWLENVDLNAAVPAALAVLNRLIEAHRIAAADPYANQLAPGAAVAVRAGFGVGAEVASGEWRRAVELTRPAGPRRPRAKTPAHPDQRLADLLAGRERPLACEELALRARLDLDLERPLAAALGTRLALEATLVELGANARASGLEQRLGELRAMRDDVIGAANAAIVGPLAQAQVQCVRHALERIEATLRARAARGLLR